MQGPAVGAPLPTGKVLAWLGCKRTLQRWRSRVQAGDFGSVGVSFFSKGPKGEEMPKCSIRTG